MPDPVSTGTAPGEPPSPIRTQPPFVAFQPGSVPPSQFVYLQLNDWITVNCLSNVANQPIQVKYRYLTPQSDIKEGTLNFTISGTFGAVSFQIGEGWLLSIAIEQFGGGASSEFVHAQVVLTRTPTGIPHLLTYALIWQGYIPAVAPTGWPGNPSKDPTDGAGVLRTISGTQPGAGADILETIPSNRRWTLMGFLAFLTASAAVANRTPQFIIDDGSSPIFFGAATFTQTASQVIQYSGSPSIPSQTPLSTNVLIPLAMPMPMKNPMRIRSSTAGLQAGDQWSAPHYLIVEWASWDF
jgi:hypothetical protein